MRRTTLTALAALAATTGLLAGQAPALASPVTLTFSSLDRGEAPTVPYLDGTTLVDGTIRVELPGRYPTLLGTSGADYLVRIAGQSSTKDIRRVRPDGTHTVLLKGQDLWEVTASGDGDRLVVTTGKQSKTRFDVLDSTTGARLAKTSAPVGYASVLDAEGAEVVYSSGMGQGGTWVWDSAQDTTRRLVKARGYHADLTNDLLAFFDRDPYRGGCSVLTSISTPEDTGWRSCQERVDSISPDGRRVTTIDLLSDGIGPSRIWLRTVEGKKRATWDAPAYFGRVMWEDDDTVLIETYSHAKSALVRCDRGDCEKATRTRPHTLPLAS